MHFYLSFLLSSLLHHQHALYSHLPSYAGESFDDVSIDSAVAFIMLSLYLGMDDPRGKYYASMAYNILKVEFPFPPLQLHLIIHILTTCTLYCTPRTHTTLLVPSNRLRSRGQGDTAHRIVHGTDART